MLASQGTRHRRRLMETLAFRTRANHRILLEAVQRAKGHAQLSDTLREAVVEYIARNAPLIGVELVLEEPGEDARQDSADVLESVAHGDGR